MRTGLESERLRGPCLPGMPGLAKLFALPEVGLQQAYIEGPVHSESS